MTGKNREPLRSLELTVAGMTVVMSVLMIAVLFGAVVGSGSIPGVNAEVCVTTTPGQGLAFNTGETGNTAVGPVGLRDGITWRADSIQVCDPRPAAATRALGGLGLTVWALAPLLFFGLLWRLLRRARREGVFADRIPAGLRVLGGFLLVWAALDFVVTGFVNAALLSKMTQTEDLVLFSSGDIPWLLALLGLTLLALERVIEQGVALREDSETTI